MRQPGRATTAQGRGWWRAAVAVAALPLVAVAMIAWHELGHTAAARVLGDGSAHFYLYQRTSTCIGCNLYDSARLAAWANAVVNAAGVLATAVLTWLAVLALAWRRRPRWLPRWLCWEVIVITTVFDVVLQVVQGWEAGVPRALRRGPGVSYVDGQAVVVFTVQATGLDVRLVATALLCLVAAYLVVVLAALHRVTRGRTS